MKEVSVSEFKKATYQEIMKRQSVIVTADGEFVFVAIILPQQMMRGKIISLGDIIEAGREHEPW